MAETTTQQVIQREAPDIEAYKIGLMEQAKATRILHKQEH